MSEWISVKDRLPEIGVDVLIYHCYHDYMEVCSYEDGTFNTYEGRRYDLEGTSHWMPLPLPPIPF